MHLLSDQGLAWHLDYGLEFAVMTVALLSQSSVPTSWIKWFDRGWHGIGVSDWLNGYLLPKLESDLAFLAQLAQDRPEFARVNQRLEREVIGDLLRAQHHLPWTAKAREQFFVEARSDREVFLKEREHALPVSQLKSLVLMAVAEGDMKMALKRFAFAWLTPTVLCSSETHRSLPTTCDDFERPYLRYANIDGLSLVRVDGTAMDPATYRRSDLMNDLSVIEALRPLIDRLADVTFPTNDEEADFTRSKTTRVRAV